MERMPNSPLILGKAEENEAWRNADTNRQARGIERRAKHYKQDTDRAHTATAPRRVDSIANPGE